MKVKIHADFPEATGSVIEFDYPKQVEVFIDVEIKRNIKPKEEGKVRFWVTGQPEGDYNQLIKENKDKYDYLLTCFDDLLLLPDSHLFMGCGSFVEPDPNIEKKFAVSSVISGRRGLPGHQLRYELFERRNEIEMPFDFYLGTWNRMQDHYYRQPNVHILHQDKPDKIRAFNCRYHIAIDSFRRDNFYSEKLIDCFITKTIPIYWGCPNIGDYFNEDGIYLVNSVDEIIELVNSFNKGYLSLADEIEENYQLALEHYKYEDILRRGIKQCLHLK